MGTTVKRGRWVPVLAFTAVWLFSVVAMAEEQGVSVENRAEAADAYDQGTSAYLSQQYEAAANWFERAYRLAPTSTALLQAVRALDKAGDSLRAANLAVQLKDEYPIDERAKQVAEVVIASVKPLNVMVEAQCAEQCTLELDGALIPHPIFFVSPDVEHSLKAAFDEGETSMFVQGAPGDIKSVKLAAPAPPPPPPIPRWAFLSSLGATVALGATAIWSGVNANNGVSAYESAARSANSPGINNGASPTPQDQAQALLADGQAKERRTNILIGVTAGMAVTTAVLGVFTNWKGESRNVSAKRIETSIGVCARGGGVTIKGRF